VPNKYLASSDNVLRHVPKRCVLRDESGNVWIAAQAFRLREHEVALSAVWLEYYGVDLKNQLSKAKSAFNAVREIKKKDGFARGNVGKILGACLSYGIVASVVNDGDESFPSHASIFDFKDDNDQLLELLASEAWSELHFVESID
jgi:hypothetical protein